MSCTATNAPFPFRHTTTSWVWLSVMVLLWGFSWPATQVALTAISPLWLATFRFGSAAICLFAFLAVRGEISLPKRGDLPIVLSIGLLQMMTFTGLGMIAMTRTDTSHSVLLAYTTPLWTVALAWIALRTRPSLKPRRFFGGRFVIVPRPLVQFPEPRRNLPRLPRAVCSRSARAG